MRQRRRGFRLVGAVGAVFAGAIVLSACVSISTTSLPGATQGSPYSTTLSATSSATGPTTWAITSGSLPAGLVIHSSTGVISGTPTGSGTSTFAVTVTDSTGSTASQNLSIAVAAGSATPRAVNMAGHENDFCAVLSTGGVNCWGDNYYGDIGNGSPSGNGSTDFSDLPVPATGITNAVSLVTDQAGYCAVLSTGAVDCWGANEFGQLGNGTSGNGTDYAVSVSPVSVSGITNAISLVADGPNSTVGAPGNGYCAVLSTGGVDCWGYNQFGQLGNGTTVSVSTYSDVPVPVTGLGS